MLSLFNLFHVQQLPAVLLYSGNYILLLNKLCIKFKLLSFKLFNLALINNDNWLIIIILIIKVFKSGCLTLIILEIKDYFKLHNYDNFNFQGLMLIIDHFVDHQILISLSKMSF